MLNSLLQAKENLGAQDLTSLRMYVTTLQLLGKVQGTHAPGDVLETLLTAHRTQKEVVFQLRSGNSGLSAMAGSEQVERERIVLSEICEQIGNCYIELVEVLRYATRIALHCIALHCSPRIGRTSSRRGCSTRPCSTTRRTRAR